MTDSLPSPKMNTCGTCKYFGELVNSGEYLDEEKDDFVENPKYHACNLLQHLNEKLRWPVAPTGVTDGSGYRATFCVTDEFGCNQWEQKP